MSDAIRALFKSRSIPDTSDANPKHRREGQFDEHDRWHDAEQALEEPA